MVHGAWSMVHGASSMQENCNSVPYGIVFCRVHPESENRKSAVYLRVTYLCFRVDSPSLFTQAIKCSRNRPESGADAATSLQPVFLQSKGVIDNLLG